MVKFIIFKESDICEFDDLYNVSSNDYNYNVDFTREIFYERFRIIIEKQNILKWNDEILWWI